MIIVIGHIVVRPDGLEAVVTLARDHCARSRAEGGCLFHRVSQDCERATHLTFVEHWTDMDALNAHFDLQASQDFVSNLGPHLSEPPEMRLYEASEIPR